MHPIQFAMLENPSNPSVVPGYIVIPPFDTPSLHELTYLLSKGASPVWRIQDFVVEH